MLTHAEDSTVIEIARLRKSFGRHQALKGVSIQVAPGEMVALIGPSGSGKSTLLRHISGLVAGDRKEGGVVRVNGKTVQKDGRISADIRSIRSEIGFIFQQFNLVGRLSLIKNVKVGMLARINTFRSLTGFFTMAEKLAAMASLKRVGLEMHAGQRASTLSGGQQQRAAIARAMEQRARLILADEPIASLDPESARMVMDSLKSLNRDDGVTILVSLHQVQFALQYCPRSIALKEGRIVYDGPSSEMTPEMLRSIYGQKCAEFLVDGTRPIELFPPAEPCGMGEDARIRAHA